MSRGIGYFTAFMGMCDSDRFPRQHLTGRSTSSSFHSLGSYNSRQVSHENYHSDSSSEDMISDSRLTHPYPYRNRHLAAPPLSPPPPPYQQRIHTYEPRMAGSSSRRGGFYSIHDYHRAARAYNAELSGEFEKFRPLPINLGDGSLEYPPEFPENAQELYLMDPREIQDLCSMFGVDAGNSREEHISAFLKYIGAIHVLRNYAERDNYGLDF
ncbi:hypothetical protein TWF694_000651 [Orbilia ellipsospora]|uniref:Uncharacterized protein n=1 Tax=Orbilia ellipsospora TaxID=2528407 RepID=A0AAV9XVW1_9PEZI